MRNSQEFLRPKQSLSLHISNKPAKSTLPKIKSFHESPSNTNNLVSYQKNHKLNLLAFPNIFANNDDLPEALNSQQKNIYQKKKEENIENPENSSQVYSKKLYEMLKFCNCDSFFKKCVKQEHKIFESPTKKKIFSNINEISSFNDLRKKAFRINNILDEKSQCLCKLTSNKKINENFLKDFKIEGSEKKSKERHIKQIEKGREFKNDHLPSPEKEIDYFENIKKQKIKRIVRIHNNKLYSINKFANMIEKEAATQNTIFRNIFTTFTTQFESILK